MSEVTKPESPTAQPHGLAASAGSPPLTVDRSHLIAWNDGILLQFESGDGIAVNELECIAAEESLKRGEIVLLRDGSRLTGNHVVLIDGCIHERMGMQANADGDGRREPAPPRQ